MAWFLFARLLFVAAVGYSAHQLEPLLGGPIVNTVFGVVLDWRSSGLRSASATVPSRTCSAR